VTYNVGDVGPGGGLVFLISGGLTYEMAPKSWGVSGAIDPTAEWCNTSSDLFTSQGIGTGSANTDLMLAGTPATCTSGAAVSARAYRGGGYSDWYLPSLEELAAMYTYSLAPGFNSPTYGFASDEYWSSSDTSANAFVKSFPDGLEYDRSKGDSKGVRAVRSF
jgi:hypothetical protein